MKKHLLIITIAFLTAFLQADAFKLQSTFSEDIMPERIIERDETGITVTYSFPGAVTVEDELYPEHVRLDIPMFGHHGDLEEPAWPVRGDSFEIPDGYEATVSVIEANWCNLDISVAPARPMLVDSSNEVFSLDNVPPVKEFIGTLPETPVAIYDRQIYRDRHIIYVAVAPVKCIDNKETMACEKLVYRIDFTPLKTNKKSNTEKIRHEVDEEYMRSLFTSTISQYNEASTYTGSLKSKWKDAPYYLILTTTEYKSSVNQFAEWKKCMGFNTEIIYSDSWTPTTIKQQIKEKYESLTNLEYVLLIGDALTLPPVRHLKGNDAPFDHSSDYTYGCMDGDNDMDQDIIIGRLNVSNASEAALVINKVIKYEKDPPVNSNYYNTSLHGSYFQDNEDNMKNYEDRRYVRTCEDIREGLKNEGFNIKRAYFAYSNVNPTNWNNGLFAYGEQLPDELLKPTFKWDGSTTDILNTVNNGAFYILHRGHGNYEGWHIPAFRISHVANLTNGDLLTMCFSINCQSGAFGHTDVIYTPTPETYIHIEKSFAEALLRAGNGGAVGIIAPSELSYSGYNEVLAMEMFQSIWPKSNVLTDFPNYVTNGINHNNVPIYSIGKILQKGKNGVMTKYLYTSLTAYTKRIYHCFGDPSMRMYTAKPKKIFKPSLNNHPTLPTPILTTSETVLVSIIRKDGTVQRATGTHFEIPELNKPYIKNPIVKISITGHNIIPNIIDDLYSTNVTASYSEISDINVSQGNINLEFIVTEGSDLKVRMRAVNSMSGTFEEFPVINDKVSIPTNDFPKGIYVIELIEDGRGVDSRKVAI